MSISRIGLVSVPVKDQQVAKSFYVDKLGFEVVMDNPFMPEAHWIIVAPKGAQTAITFVTWFPVMPPGSCQGLLFETDDIAAVHETLAARGVQTSAVESAPWGTYITLNDPDGNGLVIQQTARPGA